MNASIEINESSKTIVIDGIDKTDFERALSESDPHGFSLLDSPKVSTTAFWVGYANKARLARVRQIIADYNAKPITSPTAVKPTGRYVELVSVADRKCLNHGKSWRASGYDVDANGIAPQHEGEMICYVYAK